LSVAEKTVAKINYLCPYYRKGGKDKEITMSNNIKKCIITDICINSAILGQIMKKRASVDQASLKKLQETRDVLTRVESLPYSEELRSVMDPSVYTCSPASSVKEVVKEIATRGISSVIAVNENGRPAGILTEKDVLRRLVAADFCDNIDNVLVSDIMTPDPFTQSPDDTIYRAMSVLSAQGIKHLPLVDDGRLVGIVTLRQLLKLKYPEPMTLIEGIRDARSTEDLRKIKLMLPQMAGLKLSMGIRAFDVVVMISMINQDIHRRTFELAMAKHGSPPAPVCLYVTGSHGRLENLLSPDQDHGLIIADTGDKDLPYDPYFVDLTVTFSEMLAEIGFVTCPGYIMCLNPLWRKSLAEWKQQINFWFSHQVRELGRFLTVLFDAAPIYGDRALFSEVKTHAFSVLKTHHNALRVLHEEEGHHKAPTGIFGRFITERTGEHRGQLDVKRSGLIFMVEGIRILSLMNNLKSTSTLKRINDLAEGGHIHSDDAEYFESAYHVLLHLALEAQIEKAAAGEKIDTFISPTLLSRRDRETLRHAFKAVSSLQELVATEFGELVL